MGVSPATLYEALGNMCEQGIVGHLPRHPFVFFLAFAVLVAAPFAMRKAGVWKWLLVGMPLYWFVVTAATAVFAVTFKETLPDIVGTVLVYAMPAYLLIGLAAVAFNKGYRLATAVLVAANCYLDFFVSFLCAMMLTGDWI